MQCLILAGGLGTRMTSVNAGLPKSLLPVLGKPFMDYQLEWLAGQGVTRIVMSLGFRAALIRDHLASNNHYGMKIECVEDGDTPLGTAGAIRACVEQDTLKDGFFVLYGDSYLNADLKDIWQFSNDGRDPVMTVYGNEGQWDACNVLMEAGNLTLFQKNPPDNIKARMRHIDYGLSILSAELVLALIPVGEAHDLADVHHRLSVEGRLKAYEVYARFYEVGSPQGLSDLEEHLSHD